MSVTVTQELTQQTVTVTGNPVENNVTVTVSNARGPAGTNGPAGPNSVTTATATNLDGYIFGNGTNIAGATAATSDATPSTLVRRDANGGASLNGLTLSGTGGSPFTSTLTGGVNLANRAFTLPDASGTLATVETLANSATITASTAAAVNTIVLRDGAGKITVSNSDVSGTTAYADTAAFTYGTGAASAHRTALGLGTGDSPTFGGATLTGQIVLPLGAASTPSITFQGLVQTGFYYRSGSAGVVWSQTGADTVLFAGGRVAIPSSAAYAFSSGTNLGVQDLLLFRDAANTLAQRNGTGLQPQTFRLYNTYTSSTNFERLNFRWDSNTAKIGTEKGSASPGGTARDLVLETDGTERVRVEASGQIITKSNLRLETPTGAGAGLITTNMSNTPSLTLTQSNGNKLSINPGDGNIARSTSANVALSLSFQTGGGNVGIGTTTPASKLTVTGGDIEATDSASGVILKSPDGNRWRVTVDNTGALTTTSLA